MFLLSFLFQDGPAPCCDDSADANDDGAIDLGDAVNVLNFLFIGGPDYPEPFDRDRLECGEDPTDDDLDCQLLTCD